MISILIWWKNFGFEFNRSWILLVVFIEVESASLLHHKTETVYAGVASPVLKCCSRVFRIIIRRMTIQLYRQINFNPSLNVISLKSVKGRGQTYYKFLWTVKQWDCLEYRAQSPFTKYFSHVLPAAKYNVFW